MLCFGGEEGKEFTNKAYLKTEVCGSAKHFSAVPGNTWEMPRGIILMQREFKEVPMSTGGDTACFSMLPGLCLRLLPTTGRWIKFFIINGININK